MHFGVSSNFLYTIYESPFPKSSPPPSLTHLPGEGVSVVGGAGLGGPEITQEGLVHLRERGDPVLRGGRRTSRW